LTIQKELKRLGIKSELTRSQDMDLPLAQRTAFANRKKADLFLSIHLNSKETQTENAEGVETYILNHTSDATSKRLAELENNSQHPSPLAGTEYNKMTPDSNPDIALILKDLNLDANFAKSKALACSIQSKMSALGKDRGVRQAMFYVLLGADMPCALLEVGFLSNQNDFKKLINPLSQNKFGSAIAKGIEAFKANENQLHQLSNCKVR
jgi:N-acetylmuramoyl-L-alanine amidase